MRRLLQFLMQNQNSRSFIRNSFHQRRQNELANYLIGQMGMDADLANLFLRIHQPNNINQTLNLFLTDENERVSHVFIPKMGQEDVCRVCDAAPDHHQEHNPERVSRQIEKFKEEEASVEQEQENEERHSCEICYIEVARSNMLLIREELHNICLDCMDRYIKEEINNMRIEKISCPHCGIPLQPDVIKDLTDITTFNKYRLFLRNLEIQKSPLLKWCPNPKCSVVVSSNPDKKTSKCPKCATEICNKCSRQAHPRSSCDGAFKKEIQTWQNASDIQKCKKCQGLVEKIAGCNHMTCSICHYQWCWLCGSDYSTAHFSALNPFGCPGLQDRPRDDWGKCKIFLLRLGLLLLFIIGAPVMIPVAMILCGPILLGNIFWNCLYPSNFCKKFWLVILSIIVGLMADPLVWIGSIFYFIPLGINKLYHWYKERRENEHRRAQFLQERLLGEQVFQQKLSNA